MKPLHYVRKYGLDKSIKHTFSHSEFIADLTADFMTLLEVGKATENIKGYENAVRAIRMKWDSINNKTIGQLPNGIWKYFYVTVVCRLRENLFPEVLAERERIKQEREKRRKEYQDFEDREFGFNNSFYDFIFGSFLGNMFKDMRCPKDSFKILAIEPTKNADIIKSQYRALVMIHHPDKGGNKSKFEEITEAKNKCLLYCD